MDMHSLQTSELAKARIREYTQAAESAEARQRHEALRLRREARHQRALARAKHAAPGRRWHRRLLGAARAR